jgi:hypothetical protein
MSATLTILDPVAPAGVAAATPSFRPLATLQGKTVGFIDNSKPNFSFLADDLAELLQTKYGIARAVRHHKPTASVGASREVFADLKQQCDLVIAGSGD